MQIPIVREYRDDILNKNPENRVRGEPFFIDQPGEWTRIIVPLKSPFFIKSLKLYFKNGQPMTAEHYEIYAIMPALTHLAAQGVACMIRLKKPEIVEGLLDYDVIGEFSLFDTTMFNLIMNAVNDDRMIDWNNLLNKPLWFPPKLHTHSLLYDIVAFQDTIHLLNSISGMMEKQGRPLIQVKIEHYFNLFNHYLGVYKEMLQNFTRDHVNTYNSHGLNATQVNLGNVDNYPTATTMAEIMSGRDDLHLTIDGLKTIVDQTGFDASEFLTKNTLPISQYGNSNFIPPSIDGSFEGLGGISETAAITMESDGTVVFLANRMDGRISGLYYSTFNKLWTDENNTMEYTSYRYRHQKIEQDGATVDRIAQGSGNEVILVGNNRTNHYYIGLTNGTLDPTKHVYSRLDLTPIFNLIKPGNPVEARALLESTFFGRISVAYLGEWIYVFFAHDFQSPGVEELPLLSDARYRHVYRVRTSDVAAQLDTILQVQSVTFQDIKGIQYTNAPHWRWCTPTVNAGGTAYTSYLFDFSAPPTQMAGCYRSQQTTTAAHRDKPGKFLIRFTSFFWCRYNSPIKGLLGVDLTVEVLYEFDPETNTFTKLKNTPVPYIDWEGTLPTWTNTYRQLTSEVTQQGLIVLEDGSIIASAARYPAFPRMITGIRPSNSVSRFETMEKLWYNELAPNFVGTWKEEVISPIESSIKPRSMLFGVGGCYYLAATKRNANEIGLYYKSVSGQLTLRPDVTNLLIPNVTSQPLSNNIRKINAVLQIGGATVSVPSNQLAGYGMDVGDSAFCMGVQTKFLNVNSIGNYWGNLPHPDAIRVFGAHNLIQESNGTLSIQPTAEIIYPPAIVAQLKARVEFPGLMDQTPNTAITVTDPTGKLTDKFGWLPTLVTISYSPTGSSNYYITVLSITATYSVVGGVRTVTGFTVLDRLDLSRPGEAPRPPTEPWGWELGGAQGDSSHGAPRVGYYLNGSTLSLVLDTGVTWTGTGDTLRTNAFIRYSNRDTRRWNTGSNESYLQVFGNGGFTHYTVTPDNGVVPAFPYDSSTGGAATIYSGTVNNPLLASAYPEAGWVVFFQTNIGAVLNGKSYTLPLGSLDLRDYDESPINKTFYIYVKLEDGQAVYDVTQEKRLETPSQVWVVRVVTNDRQIITIERFNVFTINGSRVSEIKRGNSIPASSGLVNSEGQIPWLRANEMLP